MSAYDPFGRDDHMGDPSLPSGPDCDPLEVDRLAGFAAAVPRGQWIVVEHRPAINQPATHCLIDRTAPEGTQHVATFPVANDAEAVAAVLNGNDSEYRRLLNHLDDQAAF